MSTDARGFHYELAKMFALRIQERIPEERLPYIGICGEYAIKLAWMYQSSAEYHTERVIFLHFHDGVIELPNPDFTDADAEFNGAITTAKAMRQNPTLAAMIERYQATHPEAPRRSVVDPDTPFKQTTISLPLSDPDVEERLFDTLGKLGIK